MNIAELAFTTSLPYTSLVREVKILDRLFISKQLAFEMQAQTQSNWCWAATATSVSHFYWFWSNWTQCRVANGELGKTNCCSSPVPSPCNVPWYLDRALTRTNNFVSITGPVSFQQVRDEINAGRPVGARVGWSGGGGHFMVIYGYGLIVGEQYFYIDDPIYGKTQLKVTDFSSNYQGSGTWTHTYFTKSYFRMPIRVFIPKEPILRRIWEVRPLLSLKQDLMFTGDLRDVVQEGRASLGLAHPVYSLGLDALMAEQDQPLQSVAVRVYEMLDNMPRTFFDVSDEDEPRLLQMSDSSHYLDPFSRGIDEVLSMVEQDEQESELRLFRAPALNFEALWIYYEGERQDMLVPLRAVGRLTPYSRVSYSEMLDALREAARPLVQMDETMGA